MGVGHKFSFPLMNPIVYKSAFKLLQQKYPNGEPARKTSNKKIKNKGNAPGLTNWFTVFTKKCVVRLIE